MGKGLITALSTGLIAVAGPSFFYFPPPGLVQEVLPLEIPDEFKGYRERGKALPPRDGYLLGIPFHCHSFVLEGGRSVSEFFIIASRFIPPKTFELNYSRHPFIYGFDLDKNQYFGLAELVLDPEMDGLNGNEIPFRLEILKGHNNLQGFSFPKKPSPQRKIFPPKHPSEIISKKYNPNLARSRLS